jgi:hypothetical protein
VSAAVGTGFGCLPCPKCGEAGYVTVHLYDLQTFECQECGDEFTIEEIRGLVESWTRVLAWIDAVPR